MIRVEKRLPYGFVGEWGIVYKINKWEHKEGDIEYNKRQYVAMSMPVQFRDAYNKEKEKVKIANDLTATNLEDRLETTDAYWNDEDKEYQCVVQNGDIVRFGNSWWNVRAVREINFFVPNKHTIYQIDVIGVAKEMINVKK